MKAKPINWPEIIQNVEKTIEYFERIRREHWYEFTKTIKRYEDYLRKIDPSNFRFRKD